MSSLMTFILCFSLIVTPAMAEVGEVGIFTPRVYLKNAVAVNEVENFQNSMKTLMSDLSQKGAESIVDQMGEKLSGSEKRMILTLIAKSCMKRFSFNEVSAGSWQYKSGSHKIAFTLMDLHNKILTINGKSFDFRKISYEDLEKALSHYETTKSTSLIRKMFDNTFGMESAHAMGPFAVVVAIVAVVILGVAMYELKFKPERMVKRLNELQQKINEDATNCQEAGTDDAKYQKTVNLASSINERSAYNSNSPAAALQLALKTQLDAGNRNDEDCYRIMHDAGNRLGAEIPIPSDSQIQRHEGGIAPINPRADVAGAAIALCRSYNALGSCLSQFVGAQVNDSGHSLSREAVRNAIRRQQSGVTGQ